MKVEIAKQEFAVDKGSSTSISLNDDLFRTMTHGIIDPEKLYIVDVRLGVYSNEYDGVMNAFLSHKSLGPVTAAGYSCCADGLHDNDEHMVALKLAMYYDGVSFLKALDMNAENFERKLGNHALTSDDVRKILAYAFSKERWKQLFTGGFSKCNDLARALAGKLSEEEEAMKFGKPFTSVQCALYAELEKEVKKRKAAQEAAEEKLQQSIDTAYYESEISALKKKLADVNAEHCKRIADVQSLLDKIARNEDVEAADFRAVESAA